MAENELWIYKACCADGHLPPSNPLNCLVNLHRLPSRPLAVLFLLRETASVKLKRLGR